MQFKRIYLSLKASRTQTCMLTRQIGATPPWHPIVSATPPTHTPVAHATTPGPAPVDGACKPCTIVYDVCCLCLIERYNLLLTYLTLVKYQIFSGSYPKYGNFLFMTKKIRKTSHLIQKLEIFLEVTYIGILEP